MRASVFTIPGATTALNLTVDAPGVSLPEIQRSGTYDLNRRFYIDAATQNPIDSRYVGATYQLTKTSPPIETIQGTIASITNNGYDFFMSAIPAGNAGHANINILAYVLVPAGITQGSYNIPVISTAGVNIGDTITGTGIASGSLVVGFGIDDVSGSPTLILDKQTTTAIANGATVTRAQKNATLIFPVDQYVAPVEISMQPLTAGGAQVTVAATTVPYDYLDGQIVQWGVYTSDGGQANLGSTGNVNTYSNKAVTAIQLTNAGSAPVTIAFAQGGVLY